MNGSNTISVSLTFYSKSYGGRGSLIANNNYMPHFVVGDPTQKVAYKDESGMASEDYLGVRFLCDNYTVQPGIPFEIKVELMYLPTINYDALVSGADFTIREGGKVVGFGKVLSGVESALNL